MFNKETEYALRGLVYIQLQNSYNRRPGIVEIAKEIEAPQFFIAKILQRLVKQGVLQSVKGKGGGFHFAEGKESFTISDLVNLTGGNKTLNGCGFGLKHCDCENPCPLHEQYAPIREAINRLVSTETIQSLAKKYNSKIHPSESGVYSGPAV
jgi:Rrf2 family protein